MLPRSGSAHCATVVDAPHRSAVEGNRLLKVCVGQVPQVPAGQAHPLSRRFQYRAGRPYFLSSHMSRRSLVMSMTGNDGLGSIV